MLSREFVETHNEVPWKMVRGMRNYIVHEYFQVDDNVVWSVVTEDIPTLETLVKSYLETMPLQDEE